MGRKSYLGLLVACAAATVLGGMMVGMAFQGTLALPQEKVLRVSKIELVDKAGNLKAVLDAERADGPVLEIYGIRKSSLRLGLDEIGLPKVQLNGRSGNAQAILGMDEFGGELNISNKTDERVVEIYVDENLVGFVEALNRKGEGPMLTPK